MDIDSDEHAEALAEKIGGILDHCSGIQSDDPTVDNAISQLMDLWYAAYEEGWAASQKEAELVAAQGEASLGGHVE